MKLLTDKQLDDVTKIVFRHSKNPCYGPDGKRVYELENSMGARKFKRFVGLKSRALKK